MIYLDSFFSLPLTQLSSGRRLTHEEVIKGLENETVYYGASLGLGGQFSELVWINIEVAVAHYAKAVSWLSDLIFRSEFDPTRYSR